MGPCPDASDPNDPTQDGVNTERDGCSTLSQESKAKKKLFYKMI